MKLLCRPVVLMVSFGLLISCDGMAQLPDFNNPITPPVQVLIQTDISDALKQALEFGIDSAVAQASVANGFLNDGRLRIPFPPQAEKVEQKARQLGLDAQADEFIETMNTAASEASKKATPIFVNAIKRMSIQDAQGILRSDNHRAATEYLERLTRDQLYAAFKPDVEAAIESVGVTAVWNPIVSKYNALPMTEDVNPDLNDYVTQKTLDGLFLLVAEEEKKIRENPEERVTDLLKKVFGSNG